MSGTVFIDNIYKIFGQGLILTGEVKSGVIKAGMQASIEGIIISIRRIESNRTEIIEANIGDNIGFTIDLDANSKNKKFLENSISNKEIKFEESGYYKVSSVIENQKLSEKSNPNHPKGAFDWLFKIFRK